jgi:hypothetical protein
VQQQGDSQQPQQQGPSQQLPSIPHQQQVDTDEEDEAEESNKLVRAWMLPFIDMSLGRRGVVPWLPATQRILKQSGHRYSGRGCACLGGCGEGVGRVCVYVIKFLV